MRGVTKNESKVKKQYLGKKKTQGDLTIEIDR